MLLKNVTISKISEKIIFTKILLFQIQYKTTFFQINSTESRILTINVIMDKIHCLGPNRMKTLSKEKIKTSDLNKIKNVDPDKISNTDEIKLLKRDRIKINKNLNLDKSKKSILIKIRIIKSPTRIPSKSKKLFSMKKE